MNPDTLHFWNTQEIMEYLTALLAEQQGSIAFYEGELERLNSLIMDGTPLAWCAFCCRHFPADSVSFADSDDGVCAECQEHVAWMESAKVADEQEATG